MPIPATCLRTAHLATAAVLLFLWTTRVTARTITIDYGRQVEESSGLIFGGCGFNYGTVLQKYGMKLIRTYTGLDRVCPDTRTVKTDDKNIQTVLRAKQNGYTTMTAVGDCPRILSWTGTSNGVPKDWLKYEEVVKTVVKALGDNIDYIEIYNEPDWSPKILDPTGSGLTHLEAYLSIYRHAHKAIREVNKRVRIGGPTLLAPPIQGAKNSANARAYAWVTAMLADPYIKGNLDFISYHNYQAAAYPEQFEPVAQIVTAMCRSAIGRKLPVFNTEWNSHFDASSAITTQPEGFDFHGKQFIAFITSGLTGSAFYHIDGDAIVAHDTRAFYTGTQPAYPRVWVMAALSLGLNKGSIGVMRTSLSTEPMPNGYGLWGTGCLNGDNEPCALILGTGLPVEIVLDRLDFGGDATIESYLASPGNDGTRPWKSWTRSFNGGPVSITVETPVHSVLGLRIRKAVSTSIRSTSLRIQGLARPADADGTAPLRWLTFTIDGRAVLSPLPSSPPAILVGENGAAGSAGRKCAGLHRCKY